MYKKTLSAQDKLAIRSVAEQQLHAFQTNDITTAFSLSCPELQQHFGSAQGFVEMIKINYQPIYNPRAVVFEDILQTHHQPTLRMMLMTQGGNLMRAVYTMQQQADLSWRMAGCQLFSVSLDARYRH